ncbi:hypothetical protein DBR22_18710, partial [Arthrobacter sp. HMWF013]
VSGNDGDSGNGTVSGNDGDSGNGTVSGNDGDSGYDGASDYGTASGGRHNALQHLIRRHAVHTPIIPPGTDN